MRKRLLLLLLILLAASLLTPLVQDFVRNLITPLLYTFWVGLLLFRTIPQEGVWGAFVVIALLIAVVSLIKRQPGSRRPPPPKPPRQERIETWARLIRQADKEPYYRWQLAQHLRKLTLEAMAHEERTSPKQIQQQLTAGQLKIPPEIEAYLQASLTSFSRLTLSRSDAALNLELEQFISFFEERFQSEAEISLPLGDNRH